MDDFNVLDGALNALSKICEDLAEHDRSLTPSFMNALGSLFPKFIHFFRHPRVEIRRYALNAMNQFLHLMPDQLRAVLEQYLTVRHVIQSIMRL